MIIMKLIIDIPDEAYDWHVNGFPDEEDAVRLLDIVKNGTPLEESEDCVSRQKVGQWEWEQEHFTKNKNWGNWHCSECREIITVCETDWAKINKPIYKYCPNCGAKMGGEQNEVSD